MDIKITIDTAIDTGVIDQDTIIPFIFKSFTILIYLIFFMHGMYIYTFVYKISI